VGLWNWTISGLSPGTTYSYQAYVHGNGCGVASGDPVSFTTEARLTTYVTGSGTVTGGPRLCASECDDDVPNGKPLTLTATPQPGNVFVGWSAICAGQGPVCTATPTGTAQVAVTFAPGFALTVTRSGDGSGTVASAPGGIACGTACANGFLAGTTVTLTAKPDAGSAFMGWSGDCSGAQLTCTVSIDAVRNVGASFAKEKKLAVGLHGRGAVTSAPAGIDCGITCSALFPPGTAIALTPTPQDGWTFVRWEGACTGTAECAITLSVDAVVQAFFAPVFPLTVTRSGNGQGTVTSTPAGIACGKTCTASFVRGTAVTLHARARKGSKFTGWTKGCAGTKPICTVTVDRARAARATFQRG
jgi:hypothetical protein